MKRLLKNFLLCGTFGWCLEILFTSIGALRRRESNLRGQTSLWMFPIYGCGCLLRPFWLLFRNLHWFFRGVSYMGTIFLVEYLTGSFLKKKKCCPWNYENSRWNVDSVIRLDYAPFWFLTGLLFEQLVKDKESR